MTRFANRKPDPTMSGAHSVGTGPCACPFSSAESRQDASVPQRQNGRAPGTLWVPSPTIVAWAASLLCAPADGRPVGDDQALTGRNDTGDIGLDQDAKARRIERQPTYLVDGDLLNLVIQLQ